MLPNRFRVLRGCRPFELILLAAGLLVAALLLLAFATHGSAVALAPLKQHLAVLNWGGVLCD
jgi:hypothetical protein